MESMYFTEEHQLFRNSLRDFLQKEVVPHIEKWEKTGTIERFIWNKFGEMGFLGISYPEKYGGLDLDIFYMIILLEELQRINSAGFAAAIWAHAYLAMTHLNAEGSEAIKEKYLSASITGDYSLCEGSTGTICADASGQNYEWILGGAVISIDQCIEVSTGGSYQLNTSNSNCTSTSSAVVEVEAIPTLDVESSGILDCNTQNVILSATTN